MSDGDPYLRPAGLVWGRDAEEAIGEGTGGRLAGAACAFTRIELCFRQEALVQRSWHDYAGLAASRDPVISNWMETLSRPRKSVAGFGFSRPVIMGVVNVTPDSFSDGGHHPDARSGTAHARSLAEEGADLLDIGGESTRPGADPTPLHEERARVLPVIEALVADGHAVSIDTRKAALMREAAAAGARMLNDVSALTFDPCGIEVAKQSRLPVVLMHAQGDPKTMQADPRYDDVALDVFDFLRERIAHCVAAGIARERLVADPGIGFGKTFQHNLELLRRLSVLHGLGVPLMVGASRKAFIGAVSGVKPASERAPGSIGAALAAASQMVQFLRVHDVRQTVEALSVWRAATGLRGVRDPD